MFDHISVTFKITGYKETVTDQDRIKYPVGHIFVHRPMSQNVYYSLQEDVAYTLQRRRDDINKSMSCKLCFPKTAEMIDERKAPGA